MTFEVLVATMHQTDFSKIEEMNIRSDVVFANQADRTAFDTLEFDGHTAKMITTATRGVGVNRNLALICAGADICLFADDDMVYADDCAERVVQAFEELPDADVILFELDYEENGEIFLRRRHKTLRIPFWKSLKYGSARIAVRRNRIIQANICFHTQFGGGCRYSSGEDSLFLLDCYRKGLSVYTYSYCIGRTKKDSSTWFEGYTEKYFLDKGAWLACAMPKICRLMAPVLAVKWRRQNPEFGILGIWKRMDSGIRAFRAERKNRS